MRNFIALIFALVFVLAQPAFANNVEVAKLGNIEGWLIQDSTLPIVSIKIAFKKSGSAYDPEGKEGLAAFAAEMLDEGAGGMAAEEFKTELEKNAIILNFSKDKDNFYVQIKTIKDKLYIALDLMEKALKSPEFAPGSLKIVREQLITSVKKLRENPEYIAEKEWYKTAYANHPYGKPSIGTEESLNLINKTDLRNFTKASFAEDNIYISAAGDLTLEELQNIIEKHFSWLPEKDTNTEISDFTISAKGDKFIEMAIPQSIVVFGQQGIYRLDKRFYTSYILNYIIGGGSFESRLMNEIREKRGLVYNTYTDTEFMQHGAALTGYAATKNEHAGQTIALIRAELQKIKENGVTEQELDEAKKNLVGSFALKLDSNDKLVSFLNVMQLYELGTDFLEKRNEFVSSVTLKDINELAREFIKPEEFIFVTVGKKHELQTKH